MRAMFTMIFLLWVKNNVFVPMFILVLTMPCQRTKFPLMIHLMNKSEHTKETLFLLIFIYLIMLVWLDVWNMCPQLSFNFVTKKLIASIVGIFFNLFQSSSITSLTILSAIVFNVTMYFWMFDKLKKPTTSFYWKIYVSCSTRIFITIKILKCHPFNLSSYT